MQVSLSAHSPWKSLRRFPHSHRRDDAVKSGKPKTGFPTFHCHGFLFGPNSERRPGGGASLLFQAHCSIRKCSAGAKAYGFGDWCVTKSNSFEESFGPTRLLHPAPFPAPSMCPEMRSSWSQPAGGWRKPSSSANCGGLIRSLRQELDTLAELEPKVVRANERG